MINWRRGQIVVTRNRMAKEGSLHAFLDSLPDREPPLVRVPGVAIFLSPGSDTTPLALRGLVEHTGTLHQKVLIVSVETVSIPHVDDHDRFAVEKLGPRSFSIRHVTIRTGYREEPDIPGLLRECRKQGLLERNCDLEHASYLVSKITITPTSTRAFRAWRKGLFIAMARNAASPIDHFGLPSDRTVLMGSQVAV
jgi:KUP system potassium uptake protein